MAALTDDRILWAAFYIAGSECTLPARLLTYFPSHLRGLQDDLEVVHDQLAEFGESTPGKDERTSDTELAIGTLVRSQARRMSITLRSSDSRQLMLQHLDCDKGIQRAFDATLEFLASHGVTVSEPVIRVVDRFPSPYQDRRYAMLTADAGDLRKYGVAPGLYAARSHVRPFYTESLACHELIHVALGEGSPDLMGRGLEEGIAELIGSIVLSARQVGLTPTYWINIYSRNSNVYDVFWEHYNDYLRMAYFLLRRFGIGALIGLIASGREAIKVAEKELLAGEVPRLESRYDHADIGHEIHDLLDRVILRFARSMVVSPVARVVAEYVFPGRTAKEIATASGLSEEGVLGALKELSETAVVIGRRNDGFVVTSSDLEMYLTSSMLRYALP